MAAGSARAVPTAVASRVDLGLVEHIAETSLARIFSIYEKHGDADYIGEPVSTTEHSVQAFLVAREACESAEAQVACLLHDIGHLCGFEAGFEPAMDGCGTVDHEGVGARFLGALGFPESVAYLVHQHVNAKRYRCAREPDYYLQLSDASKTTLRHQGGPFTEAECLAVEAEPLWPTVLRMRTYDEAAKRTPPTNLLITAFRDELKAVLLKGIAERLESGAAGGGGGTAAAGRGGERYPMSAYAHSYVLSDEQRRAWAKDGSLALRGILPVEVAARLSAMADDLTSLPTGHSAESGEHPWMVHHERSAHDGAVRICRVENFCYHKPAWAELCFGIVQDCVSQAFGEPAVLFKDKVNYKGPGGGGFLLHQDATAYATDELASRHISVSIAVDSATLENGPLEIAPGRHSEGILPNQHGVISPEVEAAMVFEPVLAVPGDMVLFDSYLPHRSAPNHTNTWRRSAYLTFNARSQGDLHAAYYAKKKRLMREGKAGSISITKDFAGNVV